MLCCISVEEEKLLRGGHIGPQCLECLWLDHRTTQVRKEILGRSGHRPAKAALVPTVFSSSGRPDVALHQFTPVRGSPVSNTHNIWLLILNEYCLLYFKRLSASQTPSNKAAGVSILPIWLQSYRAVQDFICNKVKKNAHGFYSLTDEALSLLIRRLLMIALLCLDNWSWNSDVVKKYRIGSKQQSRLARLKQKGWE